MATSDIMSIHGIFSSVTETMAEIITSLAITTTMGIMVMGVIIISTAIITNPNIMATDGDTDITIKIIMATEEGTGIVINIIMDTDEGTEITTDTIDTNTN